jgi:hypothetical protein
VYWGHEQTVALGIFHRRFAMARRRRTSRSSSGKKLYTIRDAKGRFKDVQSYKRAHGSDIKRRSREEEE